MTRMDTPEILVTIGGAALVALIFWFFFGPRTDRRRGGRTYESSSGKGIPSGSLDDEFAKS